MCVLIALTIANKYVAPQVWINSDYVDLCDYEPIDIRFRRDQNLELFMICPISDAMRYRLYYS